MKRILSFRWIKRYGLCLLFCFYFCHPTRDKLDLSALLFSHPPISELYFSYPGRHVSFSKKQIVREVVLQEIRKAKDSIRLYVYSIDDWDIIGELYLQKRKEVKVTIFGDKEEDYKELESFGFNAKRWQSSGIHHTKVMLFDNKRMFLGTGNFTSHGLETDHNVYWIQNITPEESTSLIQTLEGNSRLGRVRIGALEYLVSPEAGKEIQTQILDAIDSANHSIRYLIFSHYDPVLSFKLEQASERGVRVEGIYNAPMSTNPEGKYLSSSLSSPSQIWEDGNVDFVYKNDSYLGGLLHHKTMLVDGKDVYVGSYNYSVSARDQNKEIFVKMSHPKIAEEFLEEWNRIVAEAQPLVATTTNDLNHKEAVWKQFFIKSYRNTFFETNLFFNQNGGLDQNSSGLAGQYRESLDLKDNTLPLQTFFENTRFVSSGVEPDSIWVDSEVSSLTLHLQNLFYGTKVSISSGEVIHSVIIWDGKSPIKTIPLDSMSVAIGVGDFRLGKDIWIWVELANRRLSFCHTKQKDKMPGWMVFLINRLVTKQNKELLCSFD
ncbi:phospholipase D-like domain-containing protein [Leptospira jelokensis]|uniref:phospholipase D-like domain-containing protein n=1 Tax=Leptospira jelokensis TaxID=2484931 RepID=UPI0010913E98|nr:phospholipase D-like domain-containing protein [Leptospira jelokensis]TGL99157.1 PLD-like domain protein [Leptospira jelokensis]